MWWIIAGVVVIGLILLVGRQLLSAGAGTDSSGLQASGTIEADEYRVSAQTGGRIQALLADEGDAVTAGQVLVRLDDALLAADMKKARAARSAAQAVLELALAGARQEDVAKAEAGVRVAQAARNGAKVAWDDAMVAGTTRRNWTCASPPLAARWRCPRRAGPGPGRHRRRAGPVRHVGHHRQPDVRLADHVLCSTIGTRLHQG